MNKIQRKRASIISKIHEWNKKLRDLQDECPHNEKTEKHRSDTGNYCKSDDRYWVEYHCMDCGKKWDEDN